jgi:predicted O-methyltransferase YrrM
VKVNPPNWQHGRVLYAAARRYLDGRRGRVLLLDIGTAKGFSALCLLWAMNDAQVAGNVVSVDVIDPMARERRNTAAEVDGFKTLTEILAPWPEADAITFLQSTGLDYLHKYAGRIEIAFVDGKHTAEVVWKEALFLADRQQSGDLAIFDDVHIPAIRAAVSSLSAYTVEWLSVLPKRAYAIARRK